MTIIKRITVASFAFAAAAAAQRPPVKLPSRPSVPPAKPFVYPPVTVDTLPNGLRFAVVENHEIPLVVVRTALEGDASLGASFLDAPGKAGTIGLMFAMLHQGTRAHSAAEINDEVLDLGTDMMFTNTSGAFTPPWFYAARSIWKPSLAILADVLRNPTFPEAVFDRVKSQASINLDRITPQSVMNRVTYAELYGPEGPHNQYATSASVAGITRDDVVAAREKYLWPQNMTIVVVGDVSVNEARQTIASAFGSWQRGGTTVAPIIPPAPGAPAPTTIYLKDRPGLSQLYMSAAQLVPGRDSPDAAAISVLASLLGDFSVSWGSRFYTAFRTERGLSYGPATLLEQSPIGEMAPLKMTATVPSALVDSAVLTTLKVVRELRQDRPATASELEFAKSNLVGRLSGTTERLDVVSRAIVNSLTDRLPAGYLNRWAERVNSLTLPEVQAAATKYLDPDHLAIVIVGDRAKLEAPLRATGIPVVIVDK